MYYFQNEFSFILFADTLELKCNKHAKYRTADGSCNNLEHPTWGMSRTEQRRFIDRFGEPMVDFENGNDFFY